ncbi:MAG TPA: ATP-binding protein [Motilibacterales bacterium]|nr:ATP-binding protein [Motilibacterales bacterium]
MPDLGHGLRNGVMQTSRHLTAQVADIADLLANVVHGIGSSDPAAAATIDFLRTWAAQARMSVAPGPVLGRGREPLDRLVDAFGLSPAERRLVLLAGLAEEHEGLAGTLRSLHPLGEPRPTVGLAALLLGEEGVDRAEVRRLLSAGAAVRHGVLRLSGSAGLFERSLSLAFPLWEVLHGVDAAPAGSQFLVLDPAPAGLDGWLDDELVRQASRVVRDGVTATVVVAAAEERIAISRVAALLESVGAQAFAVRVEPGSSVAEAAGQAAPQATARGAVPVLVLAHATGERDVQAAGAGDVGDLPGPVILCATTGSVRLDGSRPVLALPVAPVSADKRQLAWRAMLPGLDDAVATDLAAQLPLDPAWIAIVARDLRAAGQAPTLAHASAALRRRTGAVLPLGVELTTPEVGWGRLVLPEEAGFQLRDAVSRLVHQGTVLEDWQMRRTARAHRGARLLLSGLPGTGKSLAAEALATAAQTDLMRVDLSQIVSKWLGETEKNLGATFDAAERTRAVLLLDEADALFGNRTEISDAHDRYANLETAYLLQRLDTFDGLLVLTTNLRHNIDAAFLRRMDFVVDVPLPDLEGRRELWQLHLPHGHVDDDVDLDVLARMYPVPGGWIRNAALAAAFAAAAAGDGLHEHHLIAAVRREYAKAALPFPGEPPRRRHEY